MESRCAVCGTLLQAGQRFCERCGRPVAGTAAVSGKDANAGVPSGPAGVAGAGAKGKGVNSWLLPALLGVGIVVVAIGFAEWSRKPSPPLGPDPTASPSDPNGGNTGLPTPNRPALPPGPLDPTTHSAVPPSPPKQPLGNLDSQGPQK
jgi:hypothetical protein